MCIVRPQDSISADELRTRLKLISMTEEMSTGQKTAMVQSHRKNERECLAKLIYRTFKVSSSFSRRRPRKTKIEMIRSDLGEWKVNKNITKDRIAWTSFINRPTHVSMENTLKNIYIFLYIKYILLYIYKYILCVCSTSNFT